jgi:hypothetical protein
MQIELCCPRCAGRVAAVQGNAGEELLDSMFRDEPLGALGDGETFEDMLSTALTGHDPTNCPRCGAVMQVCEESLGQLALSMISRM